MELINLKENTYLIDGFAYSLLYRTGPKSCVLLDTPQPEEYAALRALLDKSGLVPSALLLSHAHHDHSGCATALRRDYGTKLYAALGEAAATLSPTALSAYIGFVSPGLLEHSFLKQCVMEMDGLILPSQKTLCLDGQTFPVIHSRGHSPDHLCFLTPDGVLFCGDALVSMDEVARQKMTYTLGVADQMASALALTDLEPELAVVSHRAVVPGADFAALCRTNVEHLEACVESLLEVVQAQPMGIDEICAAYCLGLNMERVDLAHPHKALMVRRVALAYVEYLIDTGRLEPQILGGVFRYSRPRRRQAG